MCCPVFVLSLCSLHPVAETARLNLGITGSSYASMDRVYVADMLTMVGSANVAVTARRW